MVATTQEMEGLFRPNDSLNAVILLAMKDAGHGLGERLFMSLRLRAMGRDKRLELEQAITAKLREDVDNGLVTLPVNAAITGGVLVGNWQDLFEWFLENWPAILEMIIAIIALFALDLISVSLAVYLITNLLKGLVQ